MQPWIRVLLTCVSVLVVASTAHAGTAAPELDPSSLGAGVGLASAIVLLLTHRRGGADSHDDDRS